ncbi:MAG: GUN4 domain-containing protein [Thainema sp.]
MAHSWFSSRSLVIAFAVLVGCQLFTSVIGHSSLAQTPATTATSKPPIPPGLLASDRNINYAPLQDLLRVGQWSEANQLTSQLVLQAANQRQQGYLVATDTRALPCADLQTIDRLWVYYSDNQYGLSPQAELWQQIGGQDYTDSLWFEALVGWSRPDAIANPTPTTTPQGYFPFRPAYDTGIRNAYGGWWIREMPLRLEQCASQ